MSLKPIVYKLQKALAFKGRPPESVAGDEKERRCGVMIGVYILLGIILVSLYVIIFEIGRIYECSVEIRELDEKIMKTKREIEKMNKMISELEEGAE